jgi:hypothetical protein
LHTQLAVFDLDVQEVVRLSSCYLGAWFTAHLTEPAAAVGPHALALLDARLPATEVWNKQDSV